jgi:hypothetical protein
MQANQRDFRQRWLGLLKELAFETCDFKIAAEIEVD